MVLRETGRFRGAAPLTLPRPLPKRKTRHMGGSGRYVLRSVHYNSVEPAASASPDCCIVWQVSGLRGNGGIGPGCLVRLAKALQRQPLSVHEATRVVSSIKMFVQYGEFHRSFPCRDAAYAAGSSGASALRISRSAPGG